MHANSLPLLLRLCMRGVVVFAASLGDAETGCTASHLAPLFPEEEAAAERKTRDTSGTTQERGANDYKRGTHTHTADAGQTLTRADKHGRGAESVRQEPMAMRGVCIDELLPAVSVCFVSVCG